MLENIFSSYLYRKLLDQDLKPIYKHINQTQKKDKVGRTITNYGGWQSKSFSKINSSVKPLFTSIDLIIEEIRKKLDYKYKLKLNSYWYNINSFASFNRPHRHIGPAWSTVASGVFYIKCPSKSGNIMLKTPNPLTASLYDNKINIYNSYTSSTFFIEPEKNLCVVFPSDLEHYVEPNLNKKEERISISFDYGVKDA